MTTAKAAAKARDQVIGATQAAGIKPSVKGIAANKHVIVNAVKRAIDHADSIHAIVSARDSGDPATAEIANRLLNNKEFVRAMIASVESILSDVKKAAGAKPAAVAAATHQAGPDYPEADVQPTNGSGLPGTDSRLTGPYAVAHLIRDLKAQNSAVARLALKVGMDAAMEKVHSSPLIPPWDSPVWTVEARMAYRARALGDGVAAAHIGVDFDLYKLHPEEYDQPKPHPRDFDR